MTHQSLGRTRIIGITTPLDTVDLDALLRAALRRVNNTNNVPLAALSSTRLASFLVYEPHACQTASIPIRVPPDHGVLLSVH